MPNQREVVDVDFLLPDGQLLKHPVIVISNNDINDFENGFTGVMMTSSLEYKGDPYSFVLKDGYFTKNLTTETGFSCVRVHLISTFPNARVIPNPNRGIVYMNREQFDWLLLEINERTFGFTLPE